MKTKNRIVLFSILLCALLGISYQNCGQIDPEATEENQNDSSVLNLLSGEKPIIDEKEILNNEKIDPSDSTSTKDSGSSAKPSSALLSNIKLSVGGKHACAIVNLGTGTSDQLYCWGDNSFGQLGNPSFVPSSNYPISVTLPGIPKFIAAGKNDTCAIVTVGTADKLYCWGENAQGQLGLGFTGAPVTSPTLVPLAVNFVPKTVTLGADHGCGIFNVSGVDRPYCWGRNNVGQIGRGTTVPSYLTPQFISLVPGAVKKIEAGIDHTCATSTNGGFDQLYCWGSGLNFGLGTTTLANQTSPQLINGGGAFQTTDLSLGQNHTCILEPIYNGNAYRVQYCWGSNDKGQTGTGLPTLAVQSPKYTSLIAGNWETVVQTDQGEKHGCFIMTIHPSTKTQLACWGDNSLGQMGTGPTFPNANKPILVNLSTIGMPQYVSAGGNTTCTIIQTTTNGDQIYCHGDNSKGQVGHATTNPKHDTPQLVIFPTPSPCGWQPMNPGPQAYRTTHSAVWTGIEMIIWGGFDAANSGTTYNDGGKYDPISNTWIPTSMGPGVPSPRHLHSAIWTGSQMIVWGGTVGFTGGPLGDGGIYDPANNNWAPLTSSLPNSPSARSSHSAVWTSSEMIIWGGYNGINFLSDGASYTPSTGAWTPLPPSPITGRSGHATIWAGSKMIIWGGHNNGGNLNDGAMFDLGSNSWSPMNNGGSASVLSPRANPSTVSTGSNMIIWGGSNPSTGPGDGRIYNPVSGWNNMCTPNLAPENRIWNTSIWTGSQMIVWGGLGPMYMDGGIYNP